MAKDTPATPKASANSQTTGSTVKLVMDKSQHMASELTVNGVTFVNGAAPVEVPKDEAEKLLQRRDESGHRYVAEA